MAQFSQAGGHLTILTVAAHMPPLFTEAVHQKTISEARRAHALVGAHQSIWLDKPAVFLNEIPVSDFNKMILDAINDVKPHILLVPYYDRHIDHRVIFDAAMVASRPVGTGKEIKIVAAYETLSETHWNAPHLEPNFTPNWVVDITDTIETKLDAMACFESQVHPFPEPRSLEALRALALFRGSQAGFGFGEAFHIIRMTASPGQIGGL